jgi:hypothetical protein
MHAYTDRKLSLLVRCGGDLSESVDHVATQIVRLLGLSGHSLVSDQDVGLSREDTNHLTQRTGTGTIAEIRIPGSSELGAGFHAG